MGSGGLAEMKVAGASMGHAELSQLGWTHVGRLWIHERGYVSMGIYSSLGLWIHVGCGFVGKYGSMRASMDS